MPIHPPVGSIECDGQRRSPAPWRRRKVRVVVLAVAVCALTSGLVLAPPHTVAADASSRMVDTSPVHDPTLTNDRRHASPEGEANATLAYWTDKRLRAAEPDSDSPSTFDPISTDSTIVHSVVGSIASVPWVGTLSFVRDGRDRRCSAAAIQSDSGLMVATAGHCLVSNGHYATSVAFTPGWDGKSKPYGVWATDTYQVPPEWSIREDDSHDVAFVKVIPHPGRSLEAVTNAPPADFAIAKATLHYFSLSYANIGGGFGPRPLATCVGPAYTVRAERSLAMIGCSAAPGMSGGAVYHVSSTAPKGTQVGVISRNIETANGPGTVFTPFGDVELLVFRLVDSFRRS